MMAKDKAAQAKAAQKLAAARREQARVHAADKKAKAETARFIKANDTLHKARANARAAGVRSWWR